MASPQEVTLNTIIHSRILPHCRLRFVVIVAVAVIIGCGKSNYLTVGEEAIITDKQGVFIRSGPTTQGKKVTLVPYGQSFKVLSEGDKESMYGITSKWYQVNYRSRTGWLWGGLATPNGKAGQVPKATGQCQSLHDYAEKQFKQLSIKKSLIPGPVNTHMDRSIEIETTEYERGIIGEISHGYESMGQKLKIPGGTVDDGLKILNNCYCPRVSLDMLRRTYFSTKSFPKDCLGEMQELKLGFTGKILVLEYSVHE